MMCSIMRCDPCLAAAAGLLVVGLVGTSGAQPAGDSTGELRALSVRYADGRSTNRVLGTRGRASWTVTFPRIPNADTSRDGLPLSALQFEEAPDPPNVVVTLALLYGSPHQRRVQVASVRLTDDRPVSVAELEAYGVKPVTLSLVSLPAPQLHLPSVSSPSSDLAVEAYAESDGVPGYRVRITNESSRAVMGLAFQAFRGKAKSVSGMPRGRGNAPLIPPGESYELRVEASANGNRGSSPQAWLPLDRVAITSVMWSDGLVEGEPEPAARERALAAGTAAQLARAIARLRAAAQAPAAHPLAGLRADIAALTISVEEAAAAEVHAALPDQALLTPAVVQRTMLSGMQNAKNALLNDVDEFARSGAAANPAAYADWLRAMTAKFEAWRERIVRAPR
jgi:hypothetical protein